LSVFGAKSILRLVLLEIFLGTGTWLIKSLQLELLENLFFDDKSGLPNIFPSVRRINCPYKVAPLLEFDCCPY
jgi:hypothetical protein